MKSLILLSLLFSLNLLAQEVTLIEGNAVLTLNSDISLFEEEGGAILLSGKEGKGQIFCFLSAKGEVNENAFLIKKGTPIIMSGIKSSMDDNNWHLIAWNVVNIEEVEALTCQTEDIEVPRLQEIIKKIELQN